MKKPAVPLYSGVYDVRVRIPGRGTYLLGRPLAYDEAHKKALTLEWYYRYCCWPSSVYRKTSVDTVFFSQIDLEALHRAHALDGMRRKKPLELPELPPAPKLDVIEPPLRRPEPLYDSESAAQPRRRKKDKINDNTDTATFTGDFELE